MQHLHDTESPTATRHICQEQATFAHEWQQFRECEKADGLNSFLELRRASRELWSISRREASLRERSGRFMCRTLHTQTRPCLDIPESGLEELASGDHDSERMTRLRHCYGAAVQCENSLSLRAISRGRWIVEAPSFDPKKPSGFS